MYINNLKKIVNNDYLSRDIINSSYSKISFSQFGEDLLINKIFKKIDYGKFLDLGSFHPIHFSNTFLLYLRGWRGINVDGNKSMIELTKKTRPEDISIHAFLNSSEGKSYYITNANNPAMNRISDKIENVKEDEEFLEVKTETIQNIIEKNLHFFNDQFYYLNIDLEFKDLDILQQIDFKQIRPILITIESHDLNSNELIKKTLEKNGYDFYSYINPTAFYLLKEFKENSFK